MAIFTSIAVGAILLVIWKMASNISFKSHSGSKRAASRLPPEFPYLKVPIVGHLVYMAYWILSLRIEEMFLKISKLTGNAPILRLKAGKLQYVTLNDTDTVKAVFRSDECSYRRSSIFLQGVLKNGVTSSNGDRWQRLRRFAVHSFKQYGTADEGFDAMLNNELRELLKAVMPVTDADFASKEDLGDKTGPKRFLRCRVDFKEQLTVAALNVTMWIFFRERLKYGSRETETLCQAVQNQLGNGGKLDIVDAVPGSLKLLPKWLSGMNQFEKENEIIGGFFKKTITKCMETREPGKPRHVLDDFLDEFVGRSSKDVPLEVIEEQVLGAIVDYVISAESAAAALAWCLVHVAANPWAQTRIKREISTLALDNGQFPAYSSHHKSMPYTMAAMCEALRLGTPAPVLFEHFAKEDFHSPEFTIPKGSAILPNVYQCHQEKKYWPHPERFWPERFLIFTADGQMRFQSKDSLLVFSTGKRKCLGENITWHLLFKVITGILTTYDMELTGSDIEDAMTPDPNSFFVRCPSSLRILMTTCEK